MKQRLHVARTLLHDPDVLFLDEPTLGLDIESRKSLWSYIEKLNQKFGLTILLTTHYLEEADNLAHRVAIINRGQVQVVGTPAELKHSVQGDSVVLEFAEDDSHAGAFATAIGGESFVSDVVWERGKLHLYVDNGAASVPRIMQMATTQNAAVKALSLSQPTLDDVFLKYTGTSISGTTEETTGEWWKQWAGKGGGGWQKKWQRENADETSQEQDAGDWQKWKQPGENKSSSNDQPGAWQQLQSQGSDSADSQRQWSEQHEEGQSGWPAENWQQSNDSQKKRD